MNSDKQLYLPHSAEYLGQRNKVLLKLVGYPEGRMNFCGSSVRIGDLIVEILQDTERGQRLVWQSTLDTRVQL